jgi:hypothetical protein
LEERQIEERIEVSQHGARPEQSQTLRNLSIEWLLALNQGQRVQEATLDQPAARAR